MTKANGAYGAHGASEPLKLRSFRGLRGLIVLVGLIVCLVSCSSDSPADIIEEPQEPPVTGTAIAFAADKQQEQMITRSTGLEEQGVTTFKVWGYKNMTYNDNDGYGGLQTVMNGYTVKWTANSAATTTTNSCGWEYVNQQPIGEEEQTIKYWDYSAKAYRFFGVAGADDTHKVTGKLDALTNTYKVTYKADAENEAENPYYSKLWLNDINENSSHTVQLEFIKPLSKVRFSFIFENPDDAKDTELTGKTFCPSDGNTIKMKGDVTVSYPLTGTTDKEQFAASSEAGGMTAFTQDYYATCSEEGGKVISPYLNADKTQTGKVYTVLPAPAGQSSYTMTVSVNGDPKTAVVPAQFMTWMPGYEYTYVFKIHIDGSVTIDNVQMAFTQWIEHSKDDHTIYNW